MPHIVVRTPNVAKTGASEDAFPRRRVAHEAAAVVGAFIGNPVVSAESSRGVVEPNKSKAALSAAARAAALADEPQTQPAFHTAESVLSCLNAALSVALHLRKLRETASKSHGAASSSSAAAAVAADGKSASPPAPDGNAPLAFNKQVLKKVSHVVHELAVVLGATSVGDIIRPCSHKGSSGIVLMKLPFPLEEICRRKGNPGESKSTRNRKRGLLNKCVSHIYGTEVTLKDLVRAEFFSEEEMEAFDLAERRGRGWEQWRERFDQLRMYKYLTGTAKPRFVTKDDPPDSLIRHLSRWVRQQREEYRQRQQRYAKKRDRMELAQGGRWAALTDYRIELLNELGFEWEVADVPEDLRCRAISQRGRPCKQAAVNNSKYCTIHLDYETNPPKMKKRKLNKSIDQKTSKKDGVADGHGAYCDD